MSVVKSVENKSATKAKSTSKFSRRLAKADSGSVERYELMVILRSMLSEDARAQAQKKLLQLIKNAGGEVTSTDVWGKRHLAYKIDNQGEGYYVVYRCSLQKSATKEFEQNMKLSEDVLRYLLIKESEL